MSRSKKWRLEWSFFLGEHGRRQYNKAFLGCAQECKQSLRAVLIACPRYISKRTKTARIRVSKGKIISCIGFFRGSLYDFPCTRGLANMKEKRFNFAHFPKHKTGVQLLGSSESCTLILFLFYLPTHYNLHDKSVLEKEGITL